MREDDAKVVEVDGTYEEAVASALPTSVHETGATIVSDTSWDGYEQIPRWIMAGYTQLFDEASRQWDARPDVVVVQGGVGGLVCAAASWFAARYGAAVHSWSPPNLNTRRVCWNRRKRGQPRTSAERLDTIMARPALCRALPDGVADDRVRSGCVRHRLGRRQALDTMSALAAGARARARSMLVLLVSAGSPRCGNCARTGRSALRRVRGPHACDWCNIRIRALVVITEGAPR